MLHTDAPLCVCSPDFDWSAVLTEGAQMDLKKHATAGWGYSGPLTPAGVPDISKHIYVDGSRPLPEPQQDVRSYANASVRDLFEALQPRLAVFGYSLHAPFTTDCPMDLRRAMACPVPART
jgi:hypothetical protein